jgi:hypothetical protein
MKRDAISSVEASSDSPLSGLAHIGFLTLPNFSMIAFISAHALLSDAAIAPRARVAAQYGCVDCAGDGRVRLSFAVSFQQGLSCAVRACAERGAALVGVRRGNYRAPQIACARPGKVSS